MAQPHPFTGRPPAPPTSPWAHWKSRLPQSGYAHGVPVYVGDPPSIHTFKRAQSGDSAALTKSPATRVSWWRRALGGFFLRLAALLDGQAVVDFERGKLWPTSTTSAAISRSSTPSS